MINCGFTKEMDIPYGRVIEQVREALKNEGFGILTEIDVKEKMKEKLGLDMKKYIILGACNPSNAYKAILTEENIGLMLPCKVIVQEISDGQVEVTAIDPLVSMQAVENPAVKEIASEISNKLKTVIDRV